MLAHRADETEPAEPFVDGLSPGDLQVGSVVALTETKHQKPSPVKHLHKGPLGFGVTDGTVTE